MLVYIAGSFVVRRASELQSWDSELTSSLCSVCLFVLYNKLAFLMCVLSTVRVTHKQLTLSTNTVGCELLFRSSSIGLYGQLPSHKYIKCLFKGYGTIFH